jgi:hypothetical protein
MTHTPDTLRDAICGLWVRQDVQNLLLAHADAWQSSLDWAWLAGLLDGEGSFIYHHGTPQCALKMADKDVVERAATIMGGTVRERKSHKGTGPLWEIVVYGDDARRMMRAVRPWMGKRRAERIDALLAPAALAAGETMAQIVEEHRERGDRLEGDWDAAGEADIKNWELDYELLRQRLEAAEKWRRVAAMLRSAVKSGEPWTATLEAEWDAALAAGAEHGRHR